MIADSGIKKNEEDSKKFKVFCRIRPRQSEEDHFDIEIAPNKRSLVVKTDPKNPIKEFVFHRIIQEHVSQLDFMKQICQEILNNCRQNESGSLILSYGVTNSGKTYTILGTQEQPGILPTIISQIQAQNQNEPINITAVEIYNEQFYSLKNRQKLTPIQNWGSYSFDQSEVITKQTAQDLLQIYAKNRNQASTALNSQSSRSHAIFKIHCKGINIAIVDLAGSQRVNKAVARFQESTTINSSLFVLGKCILALRDNTVVPFRESKLTKTITQYFNQKYKIYMIAHVNKSSQMVHQNINVLQYASISTKVKHMNNLMNGSILKSSKMLTRSKSKSKVKFAQDKSDVAVDQQSQIVIKSITPIKPSAKSNKNKKNLQERLIQESQKMKKQTRDNYLNQLIGRMKQHQYHLEEYFESQNRKDRQFIKSLDQIDFPVDVHQSANRNLQRKSAEVRIIMRKQILQDLQKERQEKIVHVSTEMGSSMKKSEYKRVSNFIQTQQLPIKPLSVSSVFQITLPNQKFLDDMVDQHTKYINQANKLKNASKEKQKNKQNQQSQAIHLTQVNLFNQQNKSDFFNQEKSSNNENMSKSCNIFENKESSQISPLQTRNQKKKKKNFIMWQI